MIKEQIKSFSRRILDTTGNRLLRPPFAGLGSIAMRGPNNSQKKVAITFDDGPLDPSTAEVLDALGEFGVKATFFMLGSNALAHPHLVRRVREEGHVIGNHSMNHDRKAALKLRDVEHIDLTEEVLGSFLDKQRLSLYRAPWGWLTPWEINRLRKRGKKIVGWDIDSFDWKTPAPPAIEIANLVCNQIRPGSIILMHDGFGLVREGRRSETVRALRLFIPRLQAKGYQFVTIPELLGIPAYLPGPGIEAKAS